MNAERFREAYVKLQLLDERTTHKLRGRAAGIGRLSTEQLEDRVRDLSTYTIELKEVLDELFQAIASPAAPGGASPAVPGGASPAAPGG